MPDGDPVYGTSSSSYFSNYLNARSCARKTCSNGFKFKSDSTTASTGLAIRELSLRTLAFNDTSYDLSSGTSFASPVVAGAVALVWANNPNYTADQVVTAIKDSGRPLSQLSGKVSTGKALDAGAAVRYMHAPSGLTLQ